jgi:hypothetical protein
MRIANFKRPKRKARVVRTNRRITSKRGMVISDEKIDSMLVSPF